MSKLFFYDDGPQQPFYVPIPVRKRKKYGFVNFVFDLIMIAVTSGLWLVWIFVREMRRR